ncbi:hypothetical protein [Neorhizobium galegae]|uniref:hypothetical protein n=1 Tax=Neorhizobium galegae TaxID=399 RepID=UPI000627FE2F
MWDLVKTPFSACDVYQLIDELARQNYKGGPKNGGDNVLRRSLRQTPSTIADYAETAAARMGATSGYSGRQPGDPVRAGEAMIAATEADQAPLHLVLGAICYNASPRS